MSNSKSCEKRRPEDHRNQHDAGISLLSPPERNIAAEREVNWPDQDAWPAEGGGEGQEPAAAIKKEQRKKQPTHGTAADIRGPLIFCGRRRSQGEALMANNETHSRHPRDARYETGASSRRQVW